MRFKKTIGKIHLVLGLGSGIIIVILGITGCILAFETEIRTVTDREQFVQPEEKPYVLPSLLKVNAEKVLPNKKIVGIDYPGRDKAALAYSYDSTSYFLVALNPYDGKVISFKDMNRDFFRVVLDLHYYLWLPPKIGQPIVGYSTLIFLIMLISGLILWWPRNKAAKKQRFSIKWNARWRRVNYDLHNVLGFYMTWVAIFIAITGLVMGLNWFASSFYWATSGGKALIPHEHPVSDRAYAGLVDKDLGNKLWNRHLQQAKPGESVSIYYPADQTDPLEVVLNHRPGTYYDVEAFHYDQYSGKEIFPKGDDNGTFAEASFGDKIKRMNYDIHVGAILGLPGKIMAFFASLIAASLPVTGFYVWWGRRKKKKTSLTFFYKKSKTKKLALSE